VNAVTVNAATVSTATAITNYRSGPLNVNRQLWHNVPYFVSQNTTFFGIWYLQQMLKDQGIDSKWTGHSLLLQNIPTVSASSAVSVNGQTLPVSGTVSLGGTTYVDAGSVFHALGGQSTYDAAHNTLSVSYVPAQGLSTKDLGTQGSSTQGSSAQGPGSQQAKGVASTTSVTNQVVQQPTITGGGLTSTSTSVVSVEKTLHQGTAAVFIGSSMWNQVPVVAYNRTTFFGVWYLQQILRQYGITANWDGQSLSISNMPKLVSNTQVQLGKMNLSTSVIQYNGHTLIPVTLLQSLGVSVSGDSSKVNLSTGSQTLAVHGLLESTTNQALSGLVAIQDANGTVQLLTAGSDGGFSGQTGSTGSALIGVRTASQGWIGQAIPISSSNADSLKAVADQAMVTIHGKVQFAPGKSYSVVQISVRNTITHAHYYATVQSNGTFSMSVPVGAYEAFALVTQSDAVFILQPFLASPSNTNVTVQAPALPTTKQVTSAHAIVETSDSNVTPEQLQSVDNIFEHVYQETVSSEGIVPSQKMDIHLYGTSKSYQQHYLDEGYSQTESQQIAELSVASEEGQHTINVLMPTFSTTDGLNILAHEFTHALTAVVSRTIPSWANEGGAWTQGVNAEVDHSPSSMLKQGIQWNEWVDIVAHQQSNTLIPLGGASTLSGNYNIEAQDYFAVTQLVDKFGWSKFMKYVRSIDHDANAFADTFGESFSTFSQQVTGVLAKDAARSAGTFTVKLRTLPNGPHSIYFINASGQTFLVDGLEGDQTYTFSCNADGTVTAPVGLTVTSVSDIPVAVQGDWFLGSGGTSSQNRQEFDIANQFGLPFVDQVILYSKDGNVEHVYPATAIPNGIQLVSITAG
jgi:hypothetical protein